MLERYLEEMLAITSDAERHLRSAEPRGIAELGQVRARMTQAMSAYQIYVHREVFEPASRDGSPDEIARARALKIECVMLSEEYRAFARHWAIDDIAATWPRYQPAALDWNRRVERHVGMIRDGSFAALPVPVPIHL